MQYYVRLCAIEVVNCGRSPNRNAPSMAAGCCPRQEFPRKRLEIPATGYLPCLLL